MDEITEFNQKNEKETHPKDEFLSFDEYNNKKEQSSLSIEYTRNKNEFNNNEKTPNKSSKTFFKTMVLTIGAAIVGGGVISGVTIIPGLKNKASIEIAEITDHSLTINVVTNEKGLKGLIYNDYEKRYFDITYLENEETKEYKAIGYIEGLSSNTGYNVSVEGEYTILGSSRATKSFRTLKN